MPNIVPTIAKLADTPELAHMENSDAGLYIVLAVRPSSQSDFYVLPAANSFRNATVVFATNTIANGDISFIVPYDSGPFNTDGDSIENGTITAADLISGLSSPLTSYAKIFWGWARAEAATRELTTTGRVPRKTSSDSVDALTFALMEGKIEYVPEGTAFTFSLIPVAGARMMTDRTGGVREWSNARIDEIVKDILTSQGISSAKQFVDECPVVLESIKIPQGESASTFIIETLIPQSHDALGQPFSFYMGADGSAHFVRQRRGLEADRDDGYAESDRPLRRQFVYYADRKGTVESFSPDDNQIASLLFGGYSGSVSVMHNAAGQPTEQSLSPSNGINDRGVGEYIDQHETNTNDFKGTTTLPNDLGDSTPDTRSSVTSNTQNVGGAKATVGNANARQVAYMATMATMGDGSVDALDFIEVDYFTPYGYIQAYSGVYQVLKLTHTVAPGSWKTSFGLSRQAMSTGTDTVTGKQMSATYTPHGDDTEE